jgi:hypothetical protein
MQCSLVLATPSMMLVYRVPLNRVQTQLCRDNPNKQTVTGQKSKGAVHR